MSHFDILCAWAEEAGEDDDRQAARNARVFIFEGRPEKPPLDELNEMAETFHLPFPFVACEDVGSCVLISVNDIDRRPGLSVPRPFVLAQRNKIGDSIYVGIVTAVKYVEAVVGSNSNVGIYEELRMYGRHSGEREWIGGELNIKDIPTDELSLLAKHLDTAYLQLIAALSPRNFVLETTPTAFRPEKRPKKIPRLHQRPSYTLLRPNEIRRRMRLPEPVGDGSTPAPHERRGHWRLLRDERYKRAEDGSIRRIWIDSMWIGPTENIVGNKKYKVIL